MSRNPRVCPAQINVWCCAAGGSYSSQCGNVVFARHCPHSGVGGPQVCDIYIYMYIYTLVTVTYIYMCIDMHILPLCFKEVIYVYIYTCMYISHTYVPPTLECGQCLVQIQCFCFCFLFFVFVFLCVDQIYLAIYIYIYIYVIRERREKYLCYVQKSQGVSSTN